MAKIVRMRFLLSVRNLLVFALVLVVALSSFGGGSISSWVHADGSLCLTCPVVEPAPVDDCCDPIAAEVVAEVAFEVTPESIVEAFDCQICCRAEIQEQTPHKVLPATVAVLSSQPTMVQVFRIQAGVFATQRELARKTSPYSLPSLRAPPGGGRLYEL